VLVFYDQNASALLDDNEVTRLASVVVEAGGTSATTARTTGRATLASVATGLQAFRARTDSLPPYFEAREVMANVPVSGDLMLPVTLPIGANRPAVYLALGDSITVGDGAAAGRDWVTRFESALRADWVQGEVINSGIDGNKSDQLAARIEPELANDRPAAALILIGVNDWNKCKDVDACFTQDSVRSALRSAKAARSLPFLGTIIPANPNLNPPQRNEWVEAMNQRLKAIAAQEGAVVVDTHAAFMRASGADLGRLFADHVHPNDGGHQVIADEFLRVITSPRSANAAASTLDLKWLLANPPGGVALGYGEEEASSPASPPSLFARPLPR
jgi:lysophospholipase L1-like esterase